MNIDDIELAIFTKQRIQNNQKAISSIVQWLGEKLNGNSDGKSTFDEKKLYNLYINGYGDGSGQKIDLTGSMIQTEVLEFTKELLKKQIEKDLEFIKCL